MTVHARPRVTIPLGWHEQYWAAVALHKEDPSRSNREIGRVADISHPTVAKILAEWRADPGAVEAELEAAGFLC